MTRMQEELGRFQVDIVRRDAMIDSLQEDAVGQNAAATRMEMEVRDTAAALDRIRASTTWRATGPLRSFFARRPRLTRELRRLLTPVRMDDRQPGAVASHGGGDRPEGSVEMHVSPESLDPRPPCPGTTDSEGTLDVLPRARTYVDWTLAHDTLTDDDLDAVRVAAGLLVERPLISVLMPVSDIDEDILRASIASVVGQAYPNWELCIVDDASTNFSVQRVLADYQARDSRVKIVTRTTPGGIAVASNDALGLAKGEWATLVEQDGVLRPHALYLVARAISKYPRVTCIYTDEDTIDEEGTRTNPSFKPDWNRALFYSENYLNHLVAFRRSRAMQAGGFRHAFDGAHDWDLLLRLLANVAIEEVHHIPHVLYHSRSPRASTRLSPNPKVSAFEAGTRALVDRLASDGVRADVQVVEARYRRVRYTLPEDPPAVTVVVPSTGELRLLTVCLHGLLHSTDYPTFKVLITVSQSTMELADRRSYLEELVATEPRVRLLVLEDRPFNYSWVNNEAVAHLDDDLICFLNDDTEPINQDWLASMVGHLLQDGVGAVGAKLHYPGGRIQHGGVGLGLAGVADHFHKGLPSDAEGYFGRALLDQDLSCVTAACLLTRASLFRSLGGFDETFAVAFNDVDFCIRMGKAGWRIVWTPAAELYHRESVSVGRADSQARRDQYTDEIGRLRKRWGAILGSDPHYNPNLSLECQWEPAFPPRVEYPWRMQTLG